ncbi:hypothetical protein ACTJJB_19485 [Chitinophaga sp. 22536]|uniref:hypothetical protein n=1 Tax=unclassified Chitinophaga TaxID=2619133 RepID=UPI003F8594AE
MTSDPNLLRDVYSVFNIFCGKFRQMVCTACNWSEPTFYRKMRCHYPAAGKKGRKSFLSKAEEEAILKEAHIASEHLLKLLQQHFNTPEKYPRWLEEPEEIEDAYFLSDVTVPVEGIPF